MKDSELLNFFKQTCVGKKNIKKSAQIEQVLHVSKTELRRRINRMRRKGIPIASSQDGYYYAATAGEVYATIRQLQAMVSGLNAAIRGLEHALEAFAHDDEKQS